MLQKSSQGRDAFEVDTDALLAMEGEESGCLELAEHLGNVGHWRVTLPDYALTWSAEIYHIHGVTPDEYAPDVDTAIGFYHPDDRETVISAVAAAARDGTPFEFTLRLLRRDGALRHVKSRGLAIIGPDKKPKQVFGVFIDVTEQRNVADCLQQANLKLEQIAYVDALTGLANRRQFDDMLDREWRRAAREQTALSLVMLDLDHFKSFNDRYGHVAGDGCLRAVAKAVASVARRPGDVAARYGGEEFALILPVTDGSGAEAIAPSVRDAIAALGLAHVGNQSGGGVVTASVGVSTARPRRGAGPKGRFDLVGEADQLLYEAKRTGRNRVVVPFENGDARGAAFLPNEEARLAALQVYDEAGATRRSADFDRIARLAATLTSTPIGLVSLVGRHEQRFAGNYGLEDLDGTGRDVSFCGYTIMGSEPFVVPDATRDSRFTGNALVTGDLGLRYYAGAPIVSERTGHRLGAVCIIDTSAHTETSPAQRALLADLAKMVATLLEEKVDELCPDGALP